MFQRNHQPLILLLIFLNWIILFVEFRWLVFRIVLWKLQLQVFPTVKYLLSLLVLLASLCVHLVYFLLLVLLKSNFWAKSLKQIIIIKFYLISLSIFLKIIKIVPIHWTLFFFLTFIFCIHVKSTKSTIPAFLIFWLLIHLWFFCLSKKFLVWFFAYFKCKQVCFCFTLSRINLGIIKPWKSFGVWFWGNLIIIKVTKIGKIERFFTIIFF